MDGFFVSKFYIGKRSKAAPVAEADSEPEDVLETVDVAEDGTITVTETTRDEPPTFDDAEDAAIIDASRRSHLKRKGHDPRSLKPRPAKVARKAV